MNKFLLAIILVFFCGNFAFADATKKGCEKIGKQTDNMTTEELYEYMFLIEEERKAQSPHVSWTPHYKTTTPEGVSCTVTKKVVGLSIVAQKNGVNGGGLWEPGTKSVTMYNRGQLKESDLLVDNCSRYIEHLPASVETGFAYNRR